MAGWWIRALVQLSSFTKILEGDTLFFRSWISITVAPGNNPKHITYERLQLFFLCFKKYTCPSCARSQIFWNNLSKTWILSSKFDKIRFPNTTWIYYWSKKGCKLFFLVIRVQLQPNGCTSITVNFNVEADPFTCSSSYTLIWSFENYIMGFHRHMTTDDLSSCDREAP